MQGGRGQCDRHAVLWAEKSAGAGSYCRACGIGTDAEKPGFIGFFIMACRLLRNMQELSAATGAALLEFCHVPCFGRCVVGHRCPQGADVVEVVVRAIHRAQPGRQESVRSDVLGFVGCGRFGLGFRRPLFADIAADHERAARRTEPILGGSTTTASKSRSSALKDLFGQIDGDGDGKITKSEFEEALGAGGTNLKQADSVFGKLDKDGDGSVSLKELASALKGGKEAP